MAELSINSELYQQAVTCAQKQGTSLTAVIEQLPSRYIESCQQPTGSGDAVSSGESLTTEQRLFCEIRFRRSSILPWMLPCDNCRI